MDMTLLKEYAPSLLQGFLVTLWLSFISIVLATIIGMGIALMRTSRLGWVAWPAAIYVNLFRVIPALLVLFFAFYALPQFHLRLSPLTAASIGLTLVGAAYMSEDIRGSLSAIDAGQFRAAEALGLSYAHTLRRIIIPQAIPILIPPYITRAIIMVKGTSLASMVAVGDLTGQSVRATSITYQPFMFLTIAGALYLVISGALAGFQAWAERRLARPARRGAAEVEALPA
ncbi:polar amino acid transport system permease protein/cystine transport system permease protein [Faunimonas pinastri]|uniref:Polar amino acid transport system permease protein/cystine transport system permease protein n=1 Tax=Faunimonas pinastri TaxID=1855383 RepID=A0A1H9E6V3_9HYPH|nr:amino acid ABC transporter permease [Faunimonas pinastri]SEQ21450.1 polar amino acid transport system permease protein/cystine transport system permease protein [Faunimonas pinastri]